MLTPTETVATTTCGQVKLSKWRLHPKKELGPMVVVNAQRVKSLQGYTLMSGSLDFEILGLCGSDADVGSPFSDELNATYIAWRPLQGRHYLLSPTKLVDRPKC